MKVTLTPMDINNKEFKKGMRGYNADEVDDFLDEVIENYESLYKENATLKDKINSLNEQLDQYKKIENSIQNTLILAQNAADQAKSSSEKEAELVVKNANDTAQKIIDKANNDVNQISSEYDSVKQEFIKFRARFRSFMTTQLETFEELEKDFSKNFQIASNEDEDKAEIAAFPESGEVPEMTETSVKNIQEETANADEIAEIKNFFAKSDDNL